MHLNLALKRTLFYWGNWLGAGGRGSGDQHPDVRGSARSATDTSGQS
jgi:hypothetical protein